MASATRLYDAAHRRAHDAKAVTSSFARSCLSRQHIAGPFSLIDGTPLRVDAVPGLVVHVRTAGVTISGARDAGPFVVPAGARFVSDHGGEMTIASDAHVELHFDWPEPRQ